MARSCSVLGCKESTYRNKANKVTYHKVPLDAKVRKLWLQKIRRRDYFYNKTVNIFVCSRHFQESDFLARARSGLVYLKKTAIPSKFNWNFEEDSHVPNTNEGVVCLGSPTIKESSLSQASNVHSKRRKTAETINSSGSLTSTKTTECEVTITGESSLISSEDDGLRAEVSILTETLLLKTAEIHQMKVKETKLNEELKRTRATLEDTKLKNVVLKENLKRNEERIARCLESLQNFKERNSFFQSRINELPTISLCKIKGSDADVLFYTGVSKYTTLMALYKFLEPGENGEHINYWNSKNKPTGLMGRPRILPVKQQFFMVMIRLRLGVFVKDLANIFGVSSSSVSNICISWINFMYLKLGQLKIWTTREQIDATLPQEFQETFPNLRVILDITEIKCETPSSLAPQMGTFSDNKSSTSFKGLLGINPIGNVSFVSRLFTGFISDKEITKQSGILELEFAPNDSVMADKGFSIANLLKEKNITLNIPRVINGNCQVSNKELRDAQKMATIRILIERRIRRIKGFRIFDGPIPLSLAPVINQMWTVVALLSNFQDHIIKGDTHDDSIVQML